MSSIYIFLKLSTYFSLRMPYYVEKETGKIIPDISRLLKIIRITNRRKRDFAATRRKKESRSKRPPTRLSLFVFSFTSVFFGRRVNALVEFSSFYFSRVCPLTFRLFSPDFAMRSNRLPKLNTDREFPFAFDEFIASRFLSRYYFLRDAAEIIIIRWTGRETERKKGN